MIYFPLMVALLFIGPALSGIAIRRSLSIFWHLVLLIICIFYGSSPLLLAWGGMTLAEHFNCKAKMIIFYCSDPPWLGEIITGMFFAHWLAFITIPSAVLGIIGLLISLMLKINPSQTQINISDIPTTTFYRSRRHKIIAGVCSAIAQRWKLPIQRVRIVTVILAVVIFPLVLLLYLWFWLAFPIDLPRESI
jgi:phage shock protein C